MRDARQLSAMRCFPPPDASRLPCLFWRSSRRWKGFEGADFVGQSKAGWKSWRYDSCFSREYGTFYGEKKSESRNRECFLEYNDYLVNFMKKAWKKSNKNGIYVISFPFLCIFASEFGTPFHIFPPNPFCLFRFFSIYIYRNTPSQRKIQSVKTLQ